MQMSRRYRRIDALIDAHVWLSRRKCMDDKTPMQQFKQGLETIHQASLTAINQRGNTSLPYRLHRGRGPGLQPHDAIFVVATKDRKIESPMFTREEIAGSAHRIDSFADAKVRVLVSHCSGGQE
jgi:hypothetical protein